MKKESKNKDISIIVPIYKGEKYIDNIINMAKRNWLTLNANRTVSVEVILVNDYPDEKIIIRNKGINGIEVRIIELDENKGIHTARISGLNKAYGNYILFLDQDDEIADDYLESQMNVIGSADAVLCNGIYRNNRLIYQDRQVQRDAINKVCYLKSTNTITSPGQVLMRKEAIPYQWYECVLHQNGSDDVLLWLMMFGEKKKFTINPQLLYIHKEDGNNTSLNFQNMLKSVEELVEKVKKKKILTERDYILFAQGIMNRINKYKSYNLILSKWHMLEKHGGEYFVNKGIREVAVYGMGIIGKKLIEELAILGVKVSYGIDKQAKAYQDSSIRIVNLEKDLPKVDMIIVTAVFAYDEIKKILMEKVEYSIVSVEEMLEEIISRYESSGRIDFQ